MPRLSGFILGFVIGGALFTAMSAAGLDLSLKELVRCEAGGGCRLVTEQWLEDYGLEVLRESNLRQCI